HPLSPYTTLFRPPPPTYRKAIKGTKRPATSPMRWMPPTSTNATNTVMTAPLTRGGILNVLCITSATELDCTVLPIPNPASIPNIANNTPSHFQLLPNPLRMYYMGPPTY